MSSEAITRNDLKAVLDEVLPVEPSEFKKLLWTNPNPTSAFGAQTITLDLSDYDAIELVVRHWSNNDNEMTFLCENGKYSVAQSLSPASGSYGSYRRGFNVTNSGVTFNSGLNDGATENNSTIPIRIYGIKYERITPPQVDASDYVVEQGVSDIWTYRKWESGIAECWCSQAVSINFNHNIASSLYTTGNTGTTTYPDIFVSINNVQCSGYNVAGGATWALVVSGTPNTTNKTIITAYFAWTTGGTNTLNVYISMKGRWK